MGDLRGVLAHLDHLVALGVAAIWLSPFFTSPMADFGYDVADQCDVDPVFGTLADFDALLAGCHARGIRLVIDWVPNHTSDQHPWFVSARESRDSPYRDFYVWRDEPANDWTSEFDRASPAWTFEPRTDQWYLHTFLPQQPELDWDNPAVAAAMHDTLRFWLDRGVDGFRLDAVERIAKDPELRAPDGLALWEPSLTERLRGIRAVVDEYPDRMVVGETAMAKDVRTLLRYANDPAGMQLAHDFVLCDGPWDAGVVRCHLAAWFAGAGPQAWGAWILGNHDIARFASRNGAGAARAAAVFLYGLRGTPFVFNGDELGLPDADVPASRTVDVGGRDPQRAPLPWTAAVPGHGFTAGTFTWLPFVADAATLNAAAQAADPDSALSLFRRLAALRDAEPALRAGGQAMLDAGASGEDVVAWTRDDALLVAVNFARAPRPLPAAARDGELLLSSAPGRDALDATMTADEAVIVRL